MAGQSRRLDPRRAKLHYNYTIAETARLFEVHRNTVRSWLKIGLPSIKARGVLLILGMDLRAFHENRRKARRTRTPRGQIYCMKCRRAQTPDLALIELVDVQGKTGNIRALCPCGSLLHRRANLSRLDEIGFGQLRSTAMDSDIDDTPSPSVNCDQNKD